MAPSWYPCGGAFERHPQNIAGRFLVTACAVGVTGKHFSDHRRRKEIRCRESPIHRRPQRTSFNDGLVHEAI